MNENKNETKISKIIEFSLKNNKKTLICCCIQKSI